MAKPFQAQVADWIKKSEAAMLTVAQQATQATVKEAQTPIAQGGRMPVKDGYLRNSMVGALNAIPSGSATIAGMTWNGEGVTATILRAKPGDTITIGWTAVYAGVMEARYAYMGMAVQNWQRNVNAAVNEMSRRAGR